MRLIALVLLAALVPGVARGESAAWPIEAMNRQIDATNFVVNGGCSGTLINVEHRLLLTNWHCVEKNISSYEREVTGQDGAVRKVRVRRYTDVQVAQYTKSGYRRVGASTYLTEVVAEDRNRDLALLRFRGPIPHQIASPLLPEADSVTRGERVFIVGNPLGQDATLNSGEVSQLRTVVFPWANGAEVEVIQHSGGSAGGNSGGALYNIRGQLIGVPAAGFQGAAHIGFAVSINFVRAFLLEHCWARAYDGLQGKARDAQCELERAKRNRERTE